MPLTRARLADDATRCTTVVAFLLAENGIIDKATVVDAHMLPRIQMPARTHFVTDDRKGGPVFR